MEISLLWPFVALFTGLLVAILLVTIATNYSITIRLSLSKLLSTKVHVMIIKSLICVKRTESMGHFPILPFAALFTDLSAAILLVTIATNYPITIKLSLSKLLTTNICVLIIKSLICVKQNSKYGDFTIMALFGGHLGRHLEYLKLLKGESSTSPQISLYTFR